MATEKSNSAARRRVIADILLAQEALRAWRAAACDHEFEDRISNLQVTARAIAKLLSRACEEERDNTAGLGLMFGAGLVETAEQALWYVGTGEHKGMLHASSVRALSTLALQHLDEYVLASNVEAGSKEVCHG